MQTKFALLPMIEPMPPTQAPTCHTTLDEEHNALELPACPVHFPAATVTSALLTARDAERPAEGHDGDAKLLLPLL